MRRLATSNPRTIDEVVRRLAQFTITRHEVPRLTARICSLRGTISAYDASFVALAEALDVPLLTSDMRLSRAARPYCEVIVSRA